MITCKDTHRLFQNVWSAEDKANVDMTERFQAMNLEAAGLIRMSGGGGKMKAKCTALGRRVGDALFEVKDGAS